jgi:hypothetical protein
VVIRKVTGFDSGSPNGTLVEAIEIGKRDEQANLSLQMKLQDEMAKPLNSTLRKEASDLSRIGKLKATNGINPESFIKNLH